MSKAQMLPLERVKFSACMRMRNLSVTLVSVDIGYDSNYLTNCMIKGRISANAALLLRAKYGIEPKDYDPSTPFESEVKVTYPSQNDLIQAITNALTSVLRDYKLTISIEKKEG